VGRSDHAVGLAVGPFRLRSLRFRAWRGRLPFKGFHEKAAIEIMKVRMVVSPWLIGPAGPSDVTAHLLPLSRKLGRTPVI